MSIWLAIVGMACVTFSSRYAFFVEALRYPVGPRLRRLLSYSSYAILTAIWTPIIFGYDVENGFSHAGYDFMIAGALAAVLAFIRVKTILIVLLSTGLFFWLRLFLWA